MLRVLCLLDRIGGISANKVYFRRIEDVEFEGSYFKKWGQCQWLLKLSRHADVLPVGDSKLVDKALIVLNRQSRESHYWDSSIRCFENAPNVVEIVVEEGKIVEIEEKVLEGKPS